jgi:hypothetical protein
MNELFYRFVILAVGIMNIVIDNWPMILLIVLVYIAARLVWKGSMFHE